MGVWVYMSNGIMGVWVYMSNGITNKL